eukprot:s1598_g2.t1
MSPRTQGSQARQHSASNFVPMAVALEICIRASHFHQQLRAAPLRKVGNFRYLGYALREEPACMLAESFFQTCGCQEPKWAADLTLATVFLGAMVGMLVMGRLGDMVGRARAMQVTLAFTVLGSLIPACAFGSSNTTYAVVCIGRMVLGIGVGGTYPLSAVSSAEGCEESLSRGKHVGQAFFLQQFGQLAPYLVAMLLLALFQPSTPAEWVPQLQFRLLFALGAARAQAGTLYNSVRSRLTGIFSVAGEAGESWKDRGAFCHSLPMIFWSSGALLLLPALFSSGSCTRPAIGHHFAMSRQAAKTGHAAHLHGTQAIKAAPKRSLLQRTRSHHRRHRKHREAHSRSVHHHTKHHSKRHGHVRPHSTKPTLGGAAKSASGQHGPMLGILGLVCCAAIARAVCLWWVAVRNSWKLWTSKLEQIFIALFVPALVVLVSSFSEQDSEEFTEAQVAQAQGSRRLRHAGLASTLLGTAGSWFFYDTAFYGTTIFAPTILERMCLTGSMEDGRCQQSLQQTSLQSAIITAMGIPGCYAAMMMIDRTPSRRDNSRACPSDIDISRTCSRSVFRRAGFGLDAGTTAVARSAREGNAIESLTEDGSGGLSLPRHLLHFACSSARCIGMAWPWFGQLLQNAAAKVLFCILTFLLSWGPNLGTYVLPVICFPAVGAVAGALVFPPISTGPFGVTGVLWLQAVICLLGAVVSWAFLKHDWEYMASGAGTFNVEVAGPILARGS